MEDYGDILTKMTDRGLIGHHAGVAQQIVIHEDPETRHTAFEQLPQIRDEILRRMKD